MRVYKTVNHLSSHAGKHAMLYILSYNMLSGVGFADEILQRIVAIENLNSSFHGAHVSRNVNRCVNERSQITSVAHFVSSRPFVYIHLHCTLNGLIIYLNIFRAANIT
jgi:hypothetical protein